MAKNTTFWIGGSPCCGKSTVASMLAEEFGLKYYKVDNHLDRYLDIGARKGDKLLKNMRKRSRDELWLNDVDTMVEEEFAYYRYALKIIENDLRRQYRNKDVIVEGTAILPEYIKKKGIPDDRYVCMLPTRSFQMKEFSERGWLTRYLGGTSDPDQALTNWLERDARFSQIVREEAVQNEQNLIIVDGEQDIDKVYEHIKEMFGLVTAKVD